MGSEKKNLGPATMAKLNTLADYLAAQREAEAAAAARIDQLRAEILEIADRYAFPVVSGSSEYYSSPNGRVLRITRPAAPAPTLDAAKFLERVGPEVFHAVCRVTGAEVDPEGFRGMLEAERVVEADLLDCLVERRASRPSVTLAHKLPEPVGADDPVDADLLT